MFDREKNIIQRHFSGMAKLPQAFGLSDDAAVFPAPNFGADAEPVAFDQGYVVSTDMLVEGIHFFSHDAPKSIARKALRVNLSDLAAKGARPLYFLLTICIPHRFNENWLTDFASGLQEDTKSYDIALLGGDTVRGSEQLAISITVIGHNDRTMVRRSGANIGDCLFVSGTIGDAALGLKLRAKEITRADWRLSKADANFLVERYLHPDPRVAAHEVIKNYATAAIDISDGFYLDMSRLCRSSALTICLNVAQIPVSRPAKQALAQDPKLWRTILTGGDDYELILAVSPDDVAGFIDAMAEAQVIVSNLGDLQEGCDTPVILDDNDKPLSFNHLGYQHFS